ncbi:PREDICTED: RNA polymerase II C-terminal domain phosphatase-like 4 [Camelina sativa]|uniref:RNA polymerase II C-terminal domain phosphatase-like n=1 Tax=Camelina sativa TaxID=90675 RepID=A0ABM0YFE1_CAMSA|nr:PREDICTED: RNA polymerase II C-terminal domain phosphatase-like 4 [Camelina sativa]
MSLLKQLPPQPKSKRQKGSSSSSLPCFDDFGKSLQQLSHHSASLKNHITTQLLKIIKKDKKRNKLAYDEKEEKEKERKKNKNKKKKKKKLHLVLDLDHTLIQSKVVRNLPMEEKYLLEEADSRLDLWICSYDSCCEFMIKLRPFVHEFLLEANKLFTMHVYTMSSSSYAKTVLKLIDPDKVYFGDRVITREASPYYKTLDLVKADKRRVVIVDDTVDVWPYHQRNLLQITRYKYFRDAGTMSESYAEAKKDESRRKGSLAYVLKFLKHVHKRFEEELDCKDLRPLIPDPCTQCCF